MSINTCQFFPRTLTGPAQSGTPRRGGTVNTMQNAEGMRMAEGDEYDLPATQPALFRCRRCGRKKAMAEFVPHTLRRNTPLCRACRRLQSDRTLRGIDRHGRWA